MFKNDYERLDYYYKKKWANETQLRMYVSFEVITEEEFTKISGKPFNEEPAAAISTEMA